MLKKEIDVLKEHLDMLEKRVETHHSEISQLKNPPKFTKGDFVKFSYYKNFGDDTKIESKGMLTSKPKFDNSDYSYGWRWMVIEIESHDLFDLLEQYLEKI